MIFSAVVPLTGLLLKKHTKLLKIKITWQEMNTGNYYGDGKIETIQMINKVPLEIVLPFLEKCYVPGISLDVTTRHQT